MVRPSVGVRAPPGAAFRLSPQRSRVLVHVLTRAGYAWSFENVSSMRRSSRPQPALGQAIQRVREKKGETQKVVAQRARIAIPTLSMIEGGNSNPTWATVHDIAGALGVSMGDLAKLADKLAASEK